MNQEKIGKFIAICRKEKNLTQSELDEKLGITDRAVSKWETGRSMPDISLLKDLSEILVVSIDDILNGEKTPDKNMELKYALGCETCFLKKKVNDIITSSFAIYIVIGLLLIAISSLTELYLYSYLI